MQDNNFLTSFVSFTSAVLTILLFVSQILFKSKIAGYFGINEVEGFFNTFNALAILFTIIVAVGIYSVRYLLFNHFHLNRQKYQLYLSKLKASNDEKGNPLKPEKRANDKEVYEPFYLTSQGLAFVLYFLAIVFLILVFLVPIQILKSFLYFLFVVSAMSALIIYVIMIYLQKTFERRETALREATMGKIKDYFSPEIKIESVFEEPYGSESRMLIVKEGKKYIVGSDKNNPDSNFFVQEQEELTGEGK